MYCIHKCNLFFHSLALKRNVLDLSEAINLVAYRLIGSGLSERAYGPALSLLISGRKFE